VYSQPKQEELTSKPVGTLLSIAYPFFCVAWAALAFVWPYKQNCRYISCEWLGVLCVALWCVLLWWHHWLLPRTTPPMAHTVHAATVWVGVVVVFQVLCLLFDRWPAGEMWGAKIVSVFFMEAILVMAQLDYNVRINVMRWGECRAV